jgi:DNA replication protein DnaC
MYEKRMEPYGITRSRLVFRGTPKSNSSSLATELDLDISVDAEGYSSALRTLVDTLSTANGVKLFKAAYRENMKYKQSRYDELFKQAMQEVQNQEQIINIKMPDLKRVARVDETHDNWSIFQSISEEYIEAKSHATVFEALRDRAKSNLFGDLDRDDVLAKDDAKVLRDNLVTSLKALSNFSSQSHVVEKVVEIVSSFLKHPLLFRTKVLNFMLLGSAGTGKTTLAEAIGDVFANAGLFIGKRVIEAGRADLVGQYEGQTVARTREFLTTHLDAGVIFIDEAYALTTWHEGKPESYGSEAMTAMVQFMTRYRGLYCIFVAGYEEDMTRYFLPTNQGLDRRFPDKFALRDMDADDLLHVFQRNLLRSQGQTPSDGRNAHLPSSGYFTKDAWSFLRNIVHQSMAGEAEYVEEYDSATRRTYKNVRRFQPTWTYMYEIFRHQAGSMVNLAEEAITVLMRTVSFEETVRVLKTAPGATHQPSFRAQPKSVMREIILRMISKSALSSVEHYLKEFDQIESII